MRQTSPGISSDGHSNPLHSLLGSLSTQNETLAKARLSYMLKKASEDTFEASLIVRAEGKSMAEKTVNAHSQPEWECFSQDLARLESNYDFERLKFSVLEKAWQSEYLEAKLNESVIRKQE